MSSSSVTIGPVSLQDFEVPTSIQFGGRHRLIIHRLSDGTRIIEPLGPDDCEVRFEGIFSGRDAEARARAVNNLRIAGSTVWLTWQSFRYRVIISNFSATYRSRWWICYRISCVIVHQSGAALSSSNTEQSVIFAALSAATSAVTDLPINLTSLSTALAADAALTAGTTAHAQAVLIAGQSMLTIQNQVDQQSDVLASSNHDFGNPPDAASSFTTQLASTASLANAVSARSYIGRVATSLNSLDG